MSEYGEDILDKMERCYEYWYGHRCMRTVHPASNVHYSWVDGVSHITWFTKPLT